MTKYKVGDRVEFSFGFNQILVGVVRSIDSSDPKVDNNYEIEVNGEFYINIPEYHVFRIVKNEDYDI